MGAAVPCRTSIAPHRESGCYDPNLLSEGGVKDEARFIVAASACPNIRAPGRLWARLAGRRAWGGLSARGMRAIDGSDRGGC